MTTKTRQAQPKPEAIKNQEPILWYLVLGALSVAAYFIIPLVVGYMFPDSGDAILWMLAILFLFMGYMGVKGYYGKVGMRGCLLGIVFAVGAMFLSLIPGLGWVITVAMLYYVGKGIYLSLNS